MAPDDSVQYYLDEWWLRDEGNALRRGHLVRAFVPYFGHELLRFVLEGRAEPRIHDRALFKVEPFTMGRPLPPAALPVAAVPRTGGEDYFAFKGKYRPALVLSTGGPDLPVPLRLGMPRRQTAPTVLLAPYFGVDQDGTRGGYRPEFVERIRRAEYPHFCWDELPIPGPKQSVLRLDYVYPIPREPDAFELLPFRLGEKALAIMDDWVSWLFTGTLSGESDLAFIREGLPT